jgi:hypothetical protein
MKMLQEIRGLADITHRQPAPRQPGLFLIQLRSHMVESRHPRVRQVISVDMLDRFETPRPVEIKHIQVMPSAASFDTEFQEWQPGSQF